ncbi:MAG: MFS transporter [Candidatus Omnitrophica bacterium]|nr:MFS transporter [Candidatus Omnitrophota bacterium]
MALDSFVTRSVLQIRDFRLSLASKFFVTLGLQMQAVVVGWQVYTLTRDPLALGFIGLFEALPYMGCLLWAGHLADLSEKRRMIVAAGLGLFLCNLAFLALALLKVHSVWPIYLVIGLIGVASSFLWPASSAYVDSTIPKEIYSQAAGWNSTLWQVGAILGPVLGGWLYAVSDAPLAYAGVAFFLGVSVWFAGRMSLKPPHPSPENESSLRNFLGGIRFVFSKRPVLGALSLDMFAVLFGGAAALLPIFAERLGAGASGLGVLRAAPPAGALIVALYQSHRPHFRRTGIAFLVSVWLFGLFMILFPLSELFWLSFFLLAASGAADNVSVVIRASILQALTPNHLRGRVSSVNGFFISSSNEIGAFESGVAAKLLGVVPSVIFGGLMTWFCMALTAWRVPELRRLSLKSEVEPKMILPL